MVVKNGIPAGYGFVTFSSPQEATSAVETLDQCRFEVPFPNEMKNVIEVKMAGRVP